jgi:hypothetical protein
MSVGCSLAKTHQAKLYKGWKLTVNPAELNVDGMSTACIVMFLVNYRPSGRHSVHRPQIQNFVPAIGHHFDGGSQAVIFLRGTGDGH